MAAAGTSATRPLARRRTKCCSTHKYRRRAFLGVIFAAFAQHCQQLMGHPSSMGQAGVSVVPAAERVLTAEANATSAVTHFAMGAVSVSLSAADSLMRGVDVHDAHAERTLGRAGAESSRALKDWVFRGAGGLVPDALLPQVKRFSVPVQQDSRQDFQADGIFRT